jgi:transglutaminase-like putative cysteine protease
MFAAFYKKNVSLDETVAHMRRLVRLACKDPDVLRLAREITVGLEPGDYNSEILAVYNWVDCHVRYVRDIHEVELLIAPQRLISMSKNGQASGDCDDIAMLTASLLMAIGNECRLFVAGFEPNKPSHVFCQVAVRAADAGGGNSAGGKLWHTVDTVAAENTPQMHSRILFARPYAL